MFGRTFVDFVVVDLFRARDGRCAPWPLCRACCGRTGVLGEGPGASADGTSRVVVRGRSSAPCAAGLYMREVCMLVTATGRVAGRRHKSKNVFTRPDKTAQTVVACIGYTTTLDILWSSLRNHASV